MATLVESGSAFREVGTSGPMAAEQETARGRKRSRSMTRRPTTTFRPDESSTLRGRSPRRATSPFPLPSRNTSPALRSPTSHILLVHQLRRARREHCPSRPASKSDQSSLRRTQRTRSKSRGPRISLAQEAFRSPDNFSSLRNEVRLLENGNAGEKAQR